MPIPRLGRGIIRGIQEAVVTAHAFPACAAGARFAGASARRAASARRRPACAGNDDIGGGSFFARGRKVFLVLLLFSCYGAGVVFDRRSPGCWPDRVAAKGPTRSPPVGVAGIGECAGASQPEGCDAFPPPSGTISRRSAAGGRPEVADGIKCCKTGERPPQLPRPAPCLPGIPGAVSDVSASTPAHTSPAHSSGGVRRFPHAGPADGL
jgi:hypothetical protein